MIKGQPLFWTEKGFISNILLPLSAIYLLLSLLQQFFTTKKKISVPVICVGNIYIGGTGKTPTVQKISSISQSLNKKTAILLRGYGGKINNPTYVNAAIHSSKEVGDEALIHADKFDTWVSKNRFEGAKAIKDTLNPDLIILDDGLQNRSLYSDLNIAVFDGEKGIGNGRIIPAGPLRETFYSGLKNVNIVIIIGDDKFSLENKIISLNKNITIIKAQITPCTSTIRKIREKSIIAFAGIGIPEKFFSMLQRNNINLIRNIKFPDHYEYTKNEVYNLIKSAKEKKAVLVTTEKDYKRIYDLDQSFNQHIVSIPVTLSFNNDNLLRQILEKFFSEKDKNL